MYTTRFLFLLVSIPITLATVLKVEDIFPHDLIETSRESSHHPDVGLDIEQFLEKYGYPLESYDVTTEDGYILTIHRIPHGRNESTSVNKSNKKPAVFLMHGLLSSSMDWVNLGPDAALGLLLADQGYDVWLGNNRGNTWSRKHVSLDPDTDKEFWDFSFHECAEYDLPAIIDHILNTTGHVKLSYVGFSQGTTQFFAMMSLKPEYNEKITIMSALAPIAHMKNVSQPLIKVVAKYVTEFDLVTSLLNINEFLPHMQLILDIVQTLCYQGSPLEETCAAFIFFLVGFDSPELERSFVEVIATNAPAGASTKMLTHYLQEINSGYFRRYDYGALENLEKYFALSPPEYNVSQVTAPVALYYSENDLFSAVPDVRQLASELHNLVEDHLLEYKLFNHLDYIWGKDANSIVYQYVIKLLNEYNNMGDSSIFLKV